MFYGYVKHCRTILKALILFFDAIGIHAPEEVSYTHLERFINSLVGWSASTVRSRISLVRMYFRFLFLNGDIKEPIAEKLPGGLTPRGRTKLPTVWQEDEINKLLGSIDLTNPNGKRNYAMLLLAARLGLRIGDIRELKLSDIDWQACTLTIIQNKTKEPLTLPVPDDVGWAVIDYLKNGRPVTESKNVFVRHVPPYNSFAITSSLHNIMTKALSDAGITYRGKPSGFHTLRHSPAPWQHIFTALWRNGTGWVSSLEKKNGSCMNWTG